MPRVVLVILVVVMMFTGSATWADEITKESPKRDHVKEVKFLGQFRSGLEKIERAACSYSRRNPGEFKVFQQASASPSPGDLKTENFAYSCVDPKNSRGGWLHLRPLADLEQLAGRTAEAELADTDAPDAGKVINDVVWDRREKRDTKLKYYTRHIFPDYLPDNTRLAKIRWSYEQGRQNPERMSIYRFPEGCATGFEAGKMPSGRSVCFPVSCPPGHTMASLPDGLNVCYKEPEVGAALLAWHDDTVFEQYPQEFRQPPPPPPPILEATDFTPVLVKPPKPKAPVAPPKPDFWEYIPPASQSSSGG